MKAIILTYAPVSKEEKKLLKETNIFKIATNFSASELKPNLRLTADDIVQKCLDCDTCDVVSINYDLERERVINACHQPIRHSSLLSCIDYVYLHGATSVLLVASNPPDTATAKINYEGVNNIKDCLNLYKYTKDGNLDIPFMSIEEFIMLTDEEKLLNIEQTPEKKLFKKSIFTDSVKYSVCSEGKKNESIENGKLIDSLLPFEQKQKLLDGVEEVEYNGLIIKRITTLTPKEVKKEEVKEEIKEEVKEEKAPAKKPIKKTVKKGKK